jgi:tripartite-type tricarboxylate transporter receptor subunit TctC
MANLKLPHRRQFLHLAAGAAALSILCIFGHDAWSQTARTIKIVVPTPPGGGNDILARLLAEQIGRAQGTTVVVENRVGGGTAIATEAVSRAAPDGNTVLIMGYSFVINSNLKTLNYHPLTSFEPICNLVSSPMIIVVNSASPYRTLADLLNAARAKPGGLNLAAAGPATTMHIAFELLKRAANVDITFVPYPGSAPANNALLGGHVTAVISDASVVEQLKAGKLRALAVTTAMRSEALPDIPTVAESGYPGYGEDIMIGLVAPAKTPKATISQLAGWFGAAVQLTEVKGKLAIQGLYPVATCEADFGAHLRKKYDEYSRVIREANIKAE